MRALVESEGRALEGRLVLENFVVRDFRSLFE